MLFDYAWPGNVRELQNEVQRCLILSGEDRFVREEYLSPKINPRQEADSNGADNFFEAKAEFVKRFLNQALRPLDSNKARTAEEIGLSRQGLFKLIKKHKIESPARNSARTVERERAPISPRPEAVRLRVRFPPRFLL